MPLRLLSDANAQTTIPLALAGGATSFVGASTANFTAPQNFGGGGQASLTILDAGNPSWNPAAPFATPYEYAYYSSNVVGTNTISGMTRGVAGTSAHAFLPGAIVAQGLLVEDIVASVPWLLDEQTPSGVPSITIPTSGTIPTSYLGVSWRHMVIRWSGRTTSGNGFDSLLMQLDGDPGAHYGYQLRDSVGTLISTALTTTVTSALVGTLPGGATGTNFCNTGWITFDAFALYATNRKGFALCNRNDGGAAGIRESSWEWQAPAGAAITSITLFVPAGNFTSSIFTTHLVP